MSDLIDAHLAHLRAGGYSVETLQDREKILRRLERELPYGIEHVGTADLEAWLCPFRGWTLYTYRGHIAGFYRWATGGRRPHLSWDPTQELARVRAPKNMPRPVEDDELAVALALPRPWRTAVVLARYQGLRCAEIARMRRGDITAERVLVYRKGGKTASLFVSPAVWSEVESLPPGPLIHNRRGSSYTPDELSGIVSRRLAAAGLVGVTLHRFRHSFATWMLTPADMGGGGANLRQVQVLLGHESPTSTAVYTQVSDGQLRRLMQKLPTTPGDQQPAR